MNYDYNHTEDNCDKCNKCVGVINLIKLPFIYMDKNDCKHPDVGWQFGIKEPGYRQYYVCKKCYKKTIGDK